MDLRKAFNCANHKLLRGKIQSLGFLGVSLDWSASYLQGEQQFVISYDDDENQVKSDWARLVLGLLLLLSHINDLPDTVDSFVVLIANDSSVVL